MDKTNEKHAAELVVANKKFAFQNKEKVKRESNSQYARSLIEASLDPLVTISAAGKILDVNEASINVTGVSRENLIGTDFSDYFTEPKKAQVGYRQVFEKGFVSDYPLTIKHKKGNLTDVLYNASVYKDNKGNVLGVFAAARDVTEQKWAKDLRIANKELAFQNEEKEKRAAELVIANKELAFQNNEKEKRAAELVIANEELAFQNKVKEKRAAELIVANEELAFQNNLKEKRAAELVIANEELAYQNEEKEKRAAELVIANEELAFHYEIKQKRATELNIANKELAFQNEEKEKRAAELAIANEELLFQNNEKEKRAAELAIANKELLFQNNEKEKRAAELVIAKERAEESDRLKSAFLANMSHEIRTPMNGILGFAGLLTTPNLTGEKQQEYIRIIENSGKRMLNIINDIVSISKIESGILEVNISESNLNDQMEYIHNFFKSDTDKKGIVFIANNSLAKKNVIIKTDKEKLYAILTNLVKNAIKFTNTGSIEFGCEKKGNFLEFYVKDSGVGIRQEQKTLIFERFRQGSESLNRNYEGAGLGLSISKAYVELLGGKIWVESEEGKGSAFYFTIPFLTKQKDIKLNKVVVADLNEKNQTNNLKILITEDDETTEKLISIQVKKYSKEVLIARNGLEAIQICRNNPDIDLILMDVKMPEMNGYEATKKIRQFNKKVIIVAQTAYAFMGDKEKSIETGFNDYISKPFKKNTFSELMEKHFKI
ncbi:MAG: PAS domain-containing hybrid sensor histidine kinase/response regulator [Lutibacter sp.]